ncbi:glycogen/starch/alpha-glucan phosphorylase [Altericista sp. CCNU0014]|uniref:glycogen/starch/alpha-glucan phosphorylase n=1 Tax=Altericista sp. CCNU0014 TaxID=3082949 RepID=UPI00385138BB
MQPPEIQIRVEDDRTGLSQETLKRAFLDNLFYIQGKFPRLASKNDYYMALAYTVRDRLLKRWLSTTATYLDRQQRCVCYLSAEFLMGPHLGNNLINLGIYDQVKRAVEDLCIDFEALLEQEEEPGLGNGGLGRLAACYLDSLATQEIPAFGFGIRYEFGIFDQEIKDGWQVEITDKWLRYGNPWEIPRPEWSVEVPFGGYTERFRDERGRDRIRWIPSQTIKGIPYDTPILGYRTNTANTLRLWKAEASESFNFSAFNDGDYYGAVREKVMSENLTKVLYPNDAKVIGKQLRLEQQFFFVSCTLQHLIRILAGQNFPVARFHEKFALQLNDTHPAIAIAELMRLLLDREQMDWDAAWAIVQQSFAYTNHTLLPEALEKWPIAMFGSLLPRHLEIIYEINSRFLDEVRLRFPGDNDRLARLSLIDESGERYVRMAYLACVGSHTINGVAELHSALLKKTVLADFYEVFPEKFTNKTNGVTPRRWLVLSNPRLTDLITDAIGSRWIEHLEDLRQLESYVEDAGFRAQWRQVKYAIKQDLAAYLEKRLGIQVDPQSLFDMQVKRIHEYKRQHLNILHVATLYLRLKRDPNLEMTPRTFIFGGKAAPSYTMAKLTIKLVNAVGEIVNKDPVSRDRLKVAFVPDFNVTIGQKIYPAADLSEQISTAGMEASGTGNMKFAMNGALTIGTLDGANIEIREEVGAENFFLFGLSAAEVCELKARGYRPQDYSQSNEMLQAVLDLIADGYFSHGDRDLFRPLLDRLQSDDPFLVLADYQSYIDCQDRVSQVYRDPDQWSRKSILNTARMGKFSSDRAIREYCRDIWKVEPVPIDLAAYPFDAGSCQIQ